MTPTAHRPTSGSRCTTLGPPARALVLATGQEAAALGRLAPRASLVLEPLDARGVEAIAALYAPAGTEIPVELLLEASGGVARRVHEAASEWARREATGRVDALAGQGGRRTQRGPRPRAPSSPERHRSAVDAASGSRPTPAPGADALPVQGLAAFERDDAEYFFGREELVAELVAHLVGAPLLAVVGPSGSGKSSVVRAGLLPALAGGVLPGKPELGQVVIRPGAHPARELRRAMRRLAPHRRGCWSSTSSRSCSPRAATSASGATSSRRAAARRHRS